MRKFFILALMAASLMMVSCVERRNQVILEKFIPILASDNCELKVGGDKYYTDGTIDLAFTSDYLLGFQMTNYIPASDGGDSSLTTNETNYFYAKEAEIEYEWDPKPQADGRKLTLKQELWNKKKRESLHGIVVSPNGGQAAGSLHIFEEVQIKDLLDHVNDIDWIASPLVIKVKIIGEVADGTTVETNKMNFNIRPNFGESIQMGSTYYVPEGGFQDTEENGKKVSAAKNEYNAIMAQCAFNDPIIGGCFEGQDSSQSNCYAGDTPWERYITETYGEDPYIPGYAAAGVVAMVYNTRKKSADDNGTYACCPVSAPEAPEDEEEENTDQNAAGGE